MKKKRLPGSRHISNSKPDKPVEDQVTMPKTTTAVARSRILHFKFKHRSILWGRAGRKRDEFARKDNFSAPGFEGHLNIATSIQNLWSTRCLPLLFSLQNATISLPCPISADVRIACEPTTGVSINATIANLKVVGAAPIKAVGILAIHVPIAGRGNTLMLARSGEGPQVASFVEPKGTLRMDPPSVHIAYCQRWWRVVC